MERRNATCLPPSNDRLSADFVTAAPLGRKEAQLLSRFSLDTLIFLANNVCANIPREDRFFQLSLSHPLDDEQFLGYFSLDIFI
jgi:hypothetical protein